MRPFKPIYLLALALVVSACAQDAAIPVAPTVPRIRVCLAENVPSVNVEAQMPTLRFESVAPHALDMPAGADLTLSLSPEGWRLGRELLGPGVLRLETAAASGIRINGVAYRGIMHFLPTADGKFDVVNEVDIDGYLKGVVAREMYRNWRLEAFRAQAVAARTFALYEAHTTGIGRAWDVYPDERSQAYGGISSETTLSSEAVDTTAGVVLTYGPGDGKIFKAYFSSCCGGVSQAAPDAFPGEPYIEPLREQYRGTCCSMSKYYNWGPIVIHKSELTRRFHLWAMRTSESSGQAIPEEKMAGIERIEIQAVNRYGRPTRVLLTDQHGMQFSWAAEQMRSAVNTDAQPGTTLPSSFCKINSAGDTITFYDGHGYGHGVGMCQWCAEAQAEAGASAQQILLQAYPNAKLVKAY